jgi:signal peptidase II
MQTEGRAPLTTPARLGWFVVVAISVLIVDLGTKGWAKTHLADSDLVVVDSIVRFQLVFNPGAAFSTWTGVTPVLTVIAAVAGCVVPIIALRARHLGWAIGLGLLQAGILGNLANRLFEAPGFGRGHVVDFIALPNFPVFNVADIAINIWAGLLLLLSFRGIGLDGSKSS